ncbi:hypothetical protein D3C84_1181820 [compost metagenome]
MVAVAVALDVTEPEIEVLGQQLQQRCIGAATESVAMKKVQERLASGRRVPAAQGEPGGG